MTPHWAQRNKAMPPESNPAVEVVVADLCAPTPRGATISPTDAARALAEARGEDELGWRSHLSEIRRAAVRMALEGGLVIYRKGKIVDPSEFSRRLSPGRPLRRIGRRQ